MDAAYVGSLDDTVCSQAVKSPVKTSTVAKDDIKWNEDAFFKRQVLPSASESLFAPPVASPISAFSKNVKESLLKPRFNLNDGSFLSDKANSSLGILNIENISDISACSFLSTDLVQKKKSKKKLQRSNRVPSGENLVDFQNANIEEKIMAITKDVFENLSEESADADNDSDCSSNIEYDGTNIPELNIDCNVLELINSERARFTAENTDTGTNESGVNSGTFTKNEANSSVSNSDCSQSRKSKLFDSAIKETSENMRNSIFKNFETSYESLYEQLVPEKKRTSISKNEQVPKTIRVCPFLDMSSFEVEPILQKSPEISLSSDVENGRCSQNTSVDFCPEQISARSSSFKSSLKYDSFGSETSNSHSENTKHFEINQPQMSLSKEDLENEVLSGSQFQMSSTKLDIDIPENSEEKDSGNFSKCNSSTVTENVIGRLSELSGLPMQSSFPSGNFSDFVAEGENWCSRLGISESDFFSSESAKEILKKDKEEFEKNQMFQSITSNKISGSSYWSPPSQVEHDVTAPSWFSECNSPDCRISVGTFISARSENVGCLSDDEKRERPYFGTTVVTPPKSEDTDSSVVKTSIDGNSQVFHDGAANKVRVSALSEILDEISFMDPVQFASKIVEKYLPASQKHQRSSPNQNTEKTDSETETSNESSGTLLDDIEKSGSTFVRSSDGDVSKETYIDVDDECKSTTESVDPALNFSTDSATDRESIKTAKSDPCSSCSLSSSKHSSTQEFSRPVSSCSNSSAPPVNLENGLSAQYGCMRYLNCGLEYGQNPMSNLLAVNSNFSCPHVCSQHSVQPSLLPVGTSSSLPSVMQNALSGPFLLPGTAFSYSGIQAPSELYFPEKIAIGDSQEMTLTIRNPSNITCYYHISSVSAYLNDSPLPFEMAGLSYNKTVPSNVGNTTDVKLILAPKYEGKFEINLQTDVFLNPVGQTLNVTPATSLKTKILYEVMRPSISVLYKGQSTFNLGTVIAGTTMVEHVTVVNNCEVSVPLRISLSNDSSENQIYFGLKEMDRQRHPSFDTLRFLSPTVLLYRLPASKNKSLPSSLNIPVKFESIKCSVNSCLTVAIETPTLSEVLAFIKISASVGRAKLVLKDTNQNPLMLKASLGATCSHSVTVINEGSIPVIYDIHIDGDSDVLSVSPNSLNLQPKQYATLSVTFTPQTYGTFKGNVLAAAEPHGQVFTITEIIGNVKDNYLPGPHTSNHQDLRVRPTRDSIDSAVDSSSLIECDKKYLAWGGCDIGSVDMKTFIVRNSTQESVQVKLFIKEKLNGFMLLDESSRRTNAYKLALTAKEEKNLSVLFVPKAVMSYSGKLCIKSNTPSESKIFMMPLSGYGGTANIKILDVQNGERTGYYLDVDMPSEGDVVHKSITVYNSGARAAFVKLLITYDNLLLSMDSKQTVIKPSEFVLLENEKKNVSISIHGITNKHQICNNEVISVFYGDEILRQRLRRKLKSGSSVNGSTYNINFNVPYDEEDRVPYDSAYVSSPKDETLFFTNLKKMMIHISINGKDRSFSRMSFGALSEIQESFDNMTLDSTILSSTSSSSKFRPLTIEGHSPPVKDSMGSNSRLSLPALFNENIINPINVDPVISLTEKLDSLQITSWAVYPDELIVDSDNKEKRILLKNLSDSDMKFKVEWTIDVITVSPVRGVLSAKRELGLRLSLINTNHNKLLEDYHGNVKICCNSMEKNVVIIVRGKHARNASPSPPMLNESVRSGFLGDSCFLDNTVIESSSRSLKVENVFRFPQVIDLQVAEKNVLSETTLAVSNPTKVAVKWSICPVSMMLTEPFDVSVDCSRSSIEFSSTSGVLKPMTTENIVIKFCPQSVSCYQQFFELALLPENGTIQKNTFKVSAPVGSNSSSFRSSDVNKHRRSAKKRAKSEIFLESDVCKFATASGQKSTEYITIKNISSQEVKLAITKPKPPFFTNTTTCNIKSRKFVRIPVFFKSSKTGNFEGEIRIINESGIDLRVKLNGLCLP